jgi:hypothetical protein
MSNNYQHGKPDDDHSDRDDIPNILDFGALLHLGHDEATARQLLRHAVRGTPDRPYLLPEEYETALMELRGGNQ